MAFEMTLKGGTLWIKSLGDIDVFESAKCGKSAFFFFFFSRPHCHRSLINFSITLQIQLVRLPGRNDSSDIGDFPVFSRGTT